LFLDDDTASPLDYKFVEYKQKLFKTYRLQLIFYAQLIKDNFQVPVKKGFIIYTRSKNKLVEVSIKDNDFIELEKIVDDMISIINNCRYPKPTSVKRRCPDCCYKNICESII
jgi:CRISPR-associated exonuclease Cas4